jgi:pimeloyl-ACP methyl ester carboxylesterase
MSEPAGRANQSCGASTRSGEASDVTVLVHNRVELALHHLRSGDGRRLLLLHGLGECSPAAVPAWVDGWPGPIAALDFTGHGRSTMPRGGGYTAEILLADADIALAELGPVTVLGRGLGAYIALQLAGSRPDDVVGAVLADGPGLAGGATSPTSPSYFRLPPDGPPDPYALLELSRDIRPPDYAVSFARLALAGSRLDEPITVAAVIRPQWLEAVAAEPGVAVRPISDALRYYADA